VGGEAKVVCFKILFVTAPIYETGFFYCEVRLYRLKFEGISLEESLRNIGTNSSASLFSEVCPDIFALKNTLPIKIRKHYADLSDFYKVSRARCVTIIEYHLAYL